MAREYYAVQACRTKVQGKLSTSKDLPTFYLSVDDLGIMSDDHARRLAMDILRSYSHSDDKIEVWVVRDGS